MSLNIILYFKTPARSLPDSAIPQTPNAMNSEMSIASG